MTVLPVFSPSNVAAYSFPRKLPTTCPTDPLLICLTLTAWVYHGAESGRSNALTTWRVPLAEAVRTAATVYRVTLGPKEVRPEIPAPVRGCSVMRVPDPACAEIPRPRPLIPPPPENSDSAIDCLVDVRELDPSALWSRTPAPFLRYGLIARR